MVTTGHCHQAEIISGSKETGIGIADLITISTIGDTGYYLVVAMYTGKVTGNLVPGVNIGVKDIGKEAKRKISIVTKCVNAIVMTGIGAGIGTGIGTIITTS
jgi:hypothetical protein